MDHLTSADPAELDAALGHAKSWRLTGTPLTREDFLSKRTEAHITPMRVGKGERDYVDQAV